MSKYKTVETIEVRNNVEFRYLWEVEADTEEEALRIVEHGPENRRDVFSAEPVEPVGGDWVKTKQSKVIPYIDKFKYEEK